MTNRSATEIKTNKLLKDLKIKAMDELCDTADNSSCDINDFHCSIHPLLQFAEECEKVAKEIEKQQELSLPMFNSKGESYCHNLLRCISKLFFDDKSGDPLLSSHYLKTKGIDKPPILKLKGNRFSTLFFNASEAYSTTVCRNHIKEYLVTSISTPVSYTFL